MSYPEVVVCPECDAYTDTVHELADMADGSRRYEMRPCGHVVNRYRGYRGLDDTTAPEDTRGVTRVEETADA